MGHGFGELAKVNGIVTYKLSPFEQKAFAGVISKGVPNMFRRFRSNVFTIAPRKFLCDTHSSSFYFKCFFFVSYCSIHRWLPCVRLCRKATCIVFTQKPS